MDIIFQDIKGKKRISILSCWCYPSPFESIVEMVADQKNTFSSDLTPNHYINHLDPSHQVIKVRTLTSQYGNSRDRTLFQD